MSKKVYIITLLSFIIDQVSKALVSTCFSLNESVRLINNFLYLNYINNTGASFSILTNKKYLLIVLSLIAIIIIIRYINTFKNTIFNRESVCPSTTITIKEHKFVPRITFE